MKAQGDLALIPETPLEVAALRSRVRQLEQRVKDLEAELDLRKLWTKQGIPHHRQEALIADVTAKAQPGAKVGPFTIGEPVGPLCCWCGRPTEPGSRLEYLNGKWAHDDCHEKELARRRRPHEARGSAASNACLGAP